MHALNIVRNLLSVPPDPFECDDQQACCCGSAKLQTIAGHLQMKTCCIIVMRRQVVANSTDSVRTLAGKHRIHHLLLYRYQQVTDVPWSLLPQFCATPNRVRIVFSTMAKAMPSPDQ